MKDLKTEVKEQIELLKQDIEASKYFKMDIKQDESLLQLFEKILLNLDE